MITLTDEQQRVVDFSGAAFVAACPGSGKTRVLVERARRLLPNVGKRRGVALLSFTNAAVSELEDRLCRERLLPSPAFPHFIGTFDSFVWQFLVAPFAIGMSSASPHLMRDKQELEVKPYDGAHSLPLECFDRSSGTGIPERLKRHGFKGRIAAYETVARTTRARLLEKGAIDFHDARDVTIARLNDSGTSAHLSSALAARFCELIVDEVQDCNPEDLAIIEWFRTAGVRVIVIGDPHQSIFGFRGGVTNELSQFAKKFAPESRLTLSGNFRSSAHIAKAIVGLRAPNARGYSDAALGPHRDDSTPIHLFAYSGKSAPATVGTRFYDVAQAMGLTIAECRIVAATRAAYASALGHVAETTSEKCSYRLAFATSTYHSARDSAGKLKALESVHRIVLELEGHLTDKTYQQHLTESKIEPFSWRPRVLEVVAALRFGPGGLATVDEWLNAARQTLEPFLPAGAVTISQQLKRCDELASALVSHDPSTVGGQTIHAVKGKEFPAVCVVMSPSNAKGILDFLSTGDNGKDEDARKIYVGASRAQRLLAIATPNSQAARLESLLKSTGASVTLVPL